MQNAVVIALGAALSSAALAGGGPPLAQFDFDIDGNGTTERDGTWLRISLGMLDPGSAVTFSYAFMTDEDSDPDPYNDMFRVRLHDATGKTLAHFGGAVDENDYDGNEGFEAFDFSNPDIAGTVRTEPGIGGNLSFDEGLIGWNQMTLTLDASEGDSGPTGEVFIEFLVANSDDTAVASALAIDNILINLARGGIANGSFESGFDGWQYEGEALILSSLFHQMNDDEGPEGGGSSGPITEVFFPVDGQSFALISTERLPAPGAVTLGGLALLAALRRRR